LRVKMARRARPARNSAIYIDGPEETN
jgi:hypothetical protein